jgi:tetratricopeptide (TPR) repeat protein
LAFASDIVALLSSQIMRRRFFLIIFLSFSLVTGVFAQHEHRGERLGTIVFPTSCKPSVQHDFDRAVALLHSFAYEDAAAGFMAIEREDTSCAMAYWGEAMSYYHEIWGDPPDADHLRKGLVASQRAMALGAKTSRERDYIHSILVFYSDWGHIDLKTRAHNYCSAMGQLHASYPDDTEAAVFYALSRIATESPRDPTFADRREAGAILEEVFAKNPEHPGIAHYIIHAYDKPALAGRALPAARKYAQIAPSSVHALHMPSHIFIQVGSWQEAIDSNLASVKVAREYSATHHLEGIWDMEAHAQDYLAYAYLQQGRDREAKGVMEEVAKANDRRSGESPVASYSAFAGIPARYALERRQWLEACALRDHHLPNPIYEAETHFARAVGCARGGNLEAARSSLSRLSALEEGGAVTDTAYSNRDFIEIERRAASAWIAFAENKTDEAVQLMRSAVDLEQSTLATWVPAPVLPAAEQLGDLLLNLQRPADALAAFESSMTATPNRFNGLYGAAVAAERAGDAAKTNYYFAKLIGNCNSDISDRPELTLARKHLGQ